MQLPRESGQIAYVSCPRAPSRRWPIALVSLAILSLGPLLASSSYRGDADLHATVEMLGSLFGLITGLALILYFHSLGNRLYLFYGLAFFANGAEDFVHGLLALLSTHEELALPASSLDQFIPGTYVTGRLMMAGLLLAAPFLAADRSRSDRLTAQTWTASIGVITLTAALTALAFVIDLPQFMRPERWIARPLDFASAWLFLAALGALLLHPRSAGNRLTPWIGLALSINLGGQGLIAFSRALYDPLFGAAHLCKALGYAVPLLGVALHVIALLREREQTTWRIEKTARDLHEVMQAVTERRDPELRIENDSLTPCWEIRGCRLPDCPAYQDHERAPELRCWEIEGTLCDAAVQGTFDQKIEGCRNCEVYAAARSDPFSELRETFNEMLATLAQRQRELDEACRAAEASNLAKNRFLVNMSHEIRTPMNGVMGASALLLSRPLEEEPRELAETIHESADALLRVLDEILDLSKLESGRFELRAEAVDLRRIAEQALDAVRPGAKSKGLDVEFDWPAEVPRRWVADASRLRQMWINLLSNAVKFTEHGHVRLRVVCEGAAATPARLRFEVQDTGIGVPEEARERIFEKFEQVDSSMTRRFGGSGLGLAICRRLAERMNGEIGLESRLGEGSTFWCVLPLQCVEEPALPFERAPAAGRPASRPEEAGRIPRLHCLVVDDNKVNRMIADKMLRRLGCSTEMAENGQEAVDKLGRGEQYDVVFMDCQMPVMNGYDATRTIRAGSGEASQVPIVAMTAHAMKGDREACLEAGMDDYLSKPVAIEALDELLHKIAAKRDQP